MIQIFSKEILSQGNLIEVSYNICFTAFVVYSHLAPKANLPAFVKKNQSNALIICSAMTFDDLPCIAQLVES